MQEYIIYIEKLVWSVPLVVILMFTHIFLTYKLKFPQKYTFKGLKSMLSSNNKKGKGISSFKSLMTVLAATLGTGNIVGIATAITIGGVGSIFWVFVSGIFAIATKYAETYLVLKYRKKDENGYYGGAMYVLREKLNFKLLGALFSIFLIVASFGIGAMIQSNAMSESLVNTVNLNKYVIAIVVTIICAYAIFGNEEKISNISSVLVPLATIIYLFMCIYLLFIFRLNIIPSIKLIIKEAFNFSAVTGGIFGTVAIGAINAGLSKGLFSNEAGMGSSPLFNVTVKGKDIKEESIIASTSVFIDTVIICTITGIVLVASGMWNISHNAMELVQNTFSILPYGNFLLSFSIFIFAFATIPCWGYYGSIGIKYLFKNSKIQNIYKIIYTICVYLGTILTLQIVWSISSIANALMVIPNLIMIYYLKENIES